MKKPKSRFIEDYREDAGLFDSGFTVFVDRLTGVNYLCACNGITPLLDQDDNVVVSALPIETGK